MSMTSFYGGRQGASINIVRTFDKVSIPAGTHLYRHVYYAIDSTDTANPKRVKHPFIEKTSDNFGDYAWQIVELNGGTIIASDNNTYILDTQEQEGMVEYFAQGGDTTGIDGVNYGEYVLIDTDNKEDPDNGKIFRRGLQLDNGFGGGEYRGQIVGPRGGSASLALDHYNTVDALPGKHTTSYTVNDGDLVSGATHDSIDAVWCQVEDDKGQVTDYLIGFKFPYDVIDFTANPRSPYGADGQILPATTSLIDRTDDGSHPFYEKWHMQVPRGTKGDSLTNFKIFFSEVAAGSDYYNNESDAMSQTSPVAALVTDTPIVIDTYFDYYDNGVAQIDISGTKYFINLNDGINAHFGYLQTIYNTWEDGREHDWNDVGKYKVLDKIELQSDGHLKVFYTCDTPDIISEVIRWIWMNDPSNDGIQIDDEGTITFWYNTLKADGVTHESQKYDKKFSWITKVTLDTDGTLKVFYNNDTNKSLYPAANWVDDPSAAPGEQHYYTTNLTWIKDVDINPSTGVITFTYNDDTVAAPHKVTKQLDWIKAVDLNSTGKFTFYHIDDDPTASPPVVHRDEFQTNWVSDVSIASNGTVTFDYIDTTTKQYSKMIKYLDTVSIQTTDASREDGGEGTGDQQIHVRYNNMEPSDPDIKIGNPLNYIVESLVTEDGNSWNVPANHLLVWYSDYQLRQNLATAYPGRVWRYGSLKDPTRVLDNWFDLGYVKGEVGGVRILEQIDITDINTKLYDGSGNAIPPEELLSPGVPNYDYAGWLVEVSDAAHPSQDSVLYAYNYDSNVLPSDPNKWHKIGSLSASLSDVTSFLYVGNVDPKDPSTGIVFKDNGLWFNSKTIKCVED